MYNTDLPRRAELPSARKLLRSTALAALTAAALLITTVLPAEYGIDPTGIGRALGLTPMGEIKMALAAEARAEQLPARESVPVPVAVAVPASAEVLSERRSGQQDTMTIRLKPGQGAEVKLTMSKDDRVRFEWTSSGGAVNFDTHGDPHNAPKNFYHGYGKGRQQARDAGELIAAFDGKHGWFWRNRGGGDVTVTLKTDGEYAKIDRVM